MPDRLRVAFDREIFWTQRRGGVSRYFVELARQFALHPELGIDVRLPDGCSINEHLHELDPVRYPLVRWAPTAWPLRPITYRAMRCAGRRIPREWSESDILHQTHFSPEIVARTPGAVRVITVHDLVYELMPELPSADLHAERMRRAVAAADAIICVSHTTKSDLVRLWGDWVDAPITVVHHGVAKAFAEDGPRLALSTPFVLYVGNREGYKDFGTFLRACAAPSVRQYGVAALCVGGGHLTSAERQMIEGLGLSGAVQQRDLSGRELPAAYRGALAYICPSRYEGFGLPVLEALACGCPTVVADTPALREVGGDAVCSFPPGDAGALVERMTRILEASDDESAVRRKRGVEHASGFSWHATAQSTAALYAQVHQKGEANG